MTGRAAARVFFAIWPLGAAGDEIAKQVSRLAIDGRPVAAARLHLTLAFHGRCQAPAIDALVNRAAAIDCRAFDLTVDRIGYFRRAGVVWVAPAAVPAALSSLAAKLSATNSQNIDKQPFRPHITVCRSSSRPASAYFPALSLSVTSFALVASGVDGAPGAYRALARWPLR